MLHIAVKGTDENAVITHELETSSLDNFLAFWKDCTDLTPHYQFYKSRGVDGSPFPGTKVADVKTSDNKDGTSQQEYSETYGDDESDAMLNRTDPRYDVCIYMHGPNACNAWEKKTNVQWKHKGFANAPDDDDDDSESQSESSGTEDDDGDQTSESDNSSASEEDSDNEDDDDEDEDEDEEDENEDNEDDEKEAEEQKENAHATAKGKRKAKEAEQTVPVKKPKLT